MFQNTIVLIIFYNIIYVMNVNFLWCPFNWITVAFKMYDLDDDNKISRDELLAVLHMMVGANISEEQVRVK